MSAFSRRSALSILGMTGGIGALAVESMDQQHAVEGGAAGLRVDHSRLAGALRELADAVEKGSVNVPSLKVVSSIKPDQWTAHELIINFETIGA